MASKKNKEWDVRIKKKRENKGISPRPKMNEKKTRQDKINQMQKHQSTPENMGLEGRRKKK